MDSEEDPTAFVNTMDQDPIELNTTEEEKEEDQNDYEIIQSNNQNGTEAQKGDKIIESINQDFHIIELEVKDIFSEDENIHIFLPKNILTTSNNQNETKVINNISQLKGYQCDFCDNKFQNKSQLKRHKSRTHQFDCHFCNKKFVVMLHLKNHLLSKHQANRMVEILVGKKKSKKAKLEHYYKCKFCQIHVDSTYKHQLFKYPCEYCEFNAKSLKFLSEHKNEKHAEYQKHNESIYRYAERITKEGEGVQNITNFIQGLKDTQVKIKMNVWINTHTNPKISDVIEVADNYQDIENDSIPDFSY